MTEDGAGPRPKPTAADPPPRELEPRPPALPGPVGGAPGWYPDPAGMPMTRWWNGHSWGDQFGPMPQQTPPTTDAFQSEMLRMTAQQGGNSAYTRSILFVILGLVVAGIIVVIFLNVGNDDTPAPAGDKLSHNAVESFISQNLGASNVVCNGGNDFPLVNAGDSFTCTAGGGTSYTVTIKDPASGKYVVN